MREERIFSEEIMVKIYSNLMKTIILLFKKLKKNLKKDYKKAHNSQIA